MNFSIKVKITLFILTLFIFIGAFINYSDSLKRNEEKLPLNLEPNRKYQKWVNKWKERFPQIEADHFKKVDDGEIISSANPRYSITEKNLPELQAKIEGVKDNKLVVVSPDKQQYLSFREYFTATKEATSSYVYYYGLRDDRTISGPIYECKRTKCYFDRPFFINSDIFYLPEVQLKVYPDKPSQCEIDKICTYELFLHEFDLKKNNRNTFVSSELLTDFHEIEEALNDL